MGKARRAKNSRKRIRQSKRATSPLSSLKLEDLEQRLLLASDWQNPGNRFDVDRNVATQYEVAPLDANIIITELNNRTLSSPVDGSLPVIGATDTAPTFFIDVTGDGFLGPIDAVQVINQLNLSYANGSAGSFVPASQLATTAGSSDTMVSPTSTGYANNPDSDTAGGSTVVVWEQFDTTNNAWSIVGQRYNATGAKVGTEFVVSGGTNLSQRYPTVAVNSDGAFAVAWQSRTVDADWDIAAKTYNASGSELAATVRVNGTTAGNQLNPDLAFVSDSRFAVVWEGNGTGDHNGIHGREIQLGGTAAGNEFRVNVETTGRQSHPTIGATSDGTRVIAWDGQGVVNGQASDGIFARIGDGEQIDFIGASDVLNPVVSVAADDSLVLAWLDGDQVTVQSIAADSNIVTGPELSLSFNGLEPLGGTHNYEAWVIVDSAPVSAGIFDIDDDGNPVNADGSPAKFFSRTGATAVVISIEPANDTDPDPAPTKILGGVIAANGSVALSISHPAALNTNFSTAAGEFILATPTTTVTTDEFSGVWFIDVGDDPVTEGLDLPSLPAGWEYEGWAIIDGTPVSTGRFRDPAAADGSSNFSGTDASGPAFPGEDFVRNAPNGLTFPTDLRTSSAANPIVISVEPFPDNSAAPFALKPLVGAIASDAASGVNLPMTAGSVAVSGTGSVATVDITAGRTTNISGVRSGVALDHLVGGGFVLGWTGTAGSNAVSVLTQRFDAAGSPVGGLAAVNNSSLIGFEAPAIAGASGSYLTVWRGLAVNEATGIFGRLTGVPTTASLSISEINDRTISEGTAASNHSVMAVAMNATGTPTFSLDTVAPGATINAATGLITIPINEASGPNTWAVTVTAMAGGETAQETFNLTVTEFNLAPSLGFIASPSVAANSALNFSIPAAADSDVPSNTLTYSATQTGGAALPAWLSFDAAASARSFTGTPSASDIGSVPITVTVKDQDGLEDSSSFTIMVTGVADPFAIDPIADRTVSETANDFVLTVDADVSNGATPTFTLTTNAPGATIDASTGVVSVPITSSSGGNEYNFTVTATEGTFSDTESFVLTVNEPNTAPSYASVTITDQFVVKNTAFSFVVPGATDVDVPAQTLTYTATQSNDAALPSWLSFNATSRTLSGTPVDADVGELNIKVKAADPSGLAAETEFKIKVTENGDPFFISPIGQIPTASPDTFRLNFIIVDNDGTADSPTFSLASSDVTGATVSAAGQFALPSGVASGTYNFTVTATEGSFSDEEEFTIVVDL